MQPDRQKVVKYLSEYPQLKMVSLIRSVLLLWIALCSTAYQYCLFLCCCPVVVCCCLLLLLLEKEDGARMKPS